PQGNGEFDRLDSFFAVQGDLLAVGLDLLAAPRPQIRIPPTGSVAEGVPGGLAIRAPGLFQFLAGCTVLVPGRRELAVVADLGEPRPTIGDKAAADAVRHADPFASGSGDGFADVVIAALRLADLVDDIADVDAALDIELRPIGQNVDNIGPGA